MSIFRLPKGLIAEIHRMSARFWWGSKENQRKIQWCTWKRLCKPKSDGGLRFRDIELANRANLAKQCWRILKNPDSLAAKVLKGCYYREGCFLDAESTSSLREDTVLWHFEGNGLFSVKSAYWLGKNEDNIHNTSSSNNSDSWWQLFWKLKIPLKVKIMVWKSCHDWIPTKVNIAHNGIKTLNICVGCKIANETTLHALWNCKRLRDIRADSNRQCNPNFKVIKPTCKWMPPNERRYTASCDTTVDIIKGKVGFRIVIRNNRGEVMASCVQLMVANVSIKTTKMIDVWKSIIFSGECGLTPCSFELDEALLG
ncbi:hypothetical protein Ddye_001854 [Dipteronia dyeriana]|uniref:Reverse transcriptase zinc-binding domain-containing protein n=1 Tax=Dipteronia dyeriana TaxID=168575 RepID=A0AAE0CTS7_9ROSI|nr:hypothetical protein Ddye_001854 [Dipteronia dyeriana]